MMLRPRIRIAVLAASAVAWLPASGLAADVMIVNRTARTLDVSLSRLGSGRWADLGASNRKAVRLGMNQSFPFTVSAPGKFRIFAVAPNRMQASEVVTIVDGRVNQFDLSPTYGTSPGGNTLPADFGFRSVGGEDAPDPGEGEKLGPGDLAANLGIRYERVPYADGTFGARLAEHPAAGSPAASLGLEPGDIIFELDGQRFRQHQDVIGHRQWTTVRMIDVRRPGQAQAAQVYIP